MPISSDQAPLALVKCHRARVPHDKKSRWMINHAGMDTGRGRRSGMDGYNLSRRRWWKKNEGIGKKTVQ